MGLLSYIFGINRSLSGDLYELSTEEIEQIVSPTRIQTLTPKECLLIEEKLKEARLSGSRISLRQIDLVLKKMEQAEDISQHDRQSLVAAFRNFFMNTKK